jgi:hypothetical protein
MKWLKDENIEAFLSLHNYDIRTSGNARWIDQKCTADVVTTVADCILQHADKHPDTYFTSVDIWHDEYATANVEAIFKKPNPNEKKARNEYDKFFQQPMEMLAYSGVLAKQKKGNKNFYIIAEHDILEYISIRDRNALTFLQLYIEKVLADSELLPLFEIFFAIQTKIAYENVKDGFADFTIRYTKIKGKTECNRIFIKVLNPLAYRRDTRGTAKGHLSKFKITYDMLMYNRDNFRDIYADKPKELTRRQYKEKIGLSHIFPEAEFSEICAFCENLIALTPTQHFSYAHPDGNTSRIDVAYQHVCLLAKASVIKETLEDLSRSQIYEFGRFMYVLSVGLDDENFINIAERDFERAISAINLAYAER